MGTVLAILVHNGSNGPENYFVFSWAFLGGGEVVLL